MKRKKPTLTATLAAAQKEQEKATNDQLRARLRGLLFRFGLATGDDTNNIFHPNHGGWHPPRR